MKNKILRIVGHRDIYIPALLLIVLSIPFFFNADLDITISSLFYDPLAPIPWVLRTKQPWQALYHYGTWPSLTIAATGLLIFLAGFINKRLAGHRKKAFLLAAVMIIGPGLIVNSIFKDNFGRPRPNQIIEFGGQQQYHRLLQSDWGNDGRGFPCGHCSTGFYFFTFYFFWKRDRRKWLPYAAGIGGGVVYGIMMSIARIGQGGHFATDVLWSAGLIYLTAGFLYYLLFPDDKLKG